MDRNHWHLPQVEGSVTTTNREPDALTLPKELMVLVLDLSTAVHRIAAALERRVEQEGGKLLRERSILVGHVATFEHQRSRANQQQIDWAADELATFDRIYPWIAAKAEASE
jgi:hypothetical protein